MYYDVLAVLSLLSAAITDYKHRTIPNAAVLAICACAIVKALSQGKPLHELLLGGLGMSAFVVFITVLTRSEIGGGDIKLSISLGLLFGCFDAIGIFIISLLLMLIHGTFRRKKAMPFAPYALISVLAYEVFQIVN